MRADGRPFASAVASDIASGTSTPAARASSNHSWKTASGSVTASRSRGSRAPRPRRPAPAALELLPPLAPAAPPHPLDLVVRQLVRAREDAVAEQLARLCRAGDAVGGLVEPRLLPPRAGDPP